MPSLAEQTWASARIEGIPCGRIFFVASGAARFVQEGGREWSLGRRQIMWAPAGWAGSFRMGAGGGGTAVLVAEEAIARILNQSSLASNIRPLLRSVQIASAMTDAGVLRDLEAIFDSLVRENRDPGPGATALLDHLLGAIFIHVWRLSGAEVAEGGFAIEAPLGQRFRQLVEMHFRDGLGVADFARMLGATRSQLHSACLKGFGRPPHRLVSERLAVEARTRLRETAQSVEEIAFGLRFKDASYFNRFFRRMSGVSPGAYRRASRSAPPQASTAFEAWP